MLKYEDWAGVLEIGDYAKRDSKFLSFKMKRYFKKSLKKLNDHAER